MIRNPYAKAPPRKPNASNTAAASPATKRPRPSSPRSGVVENEPSATTATTATCGMNRPLKAPSTQPTRVGDTGSISRLVQPTCASHVVPGQNRLAEHNNYARHAISGRNVCGGDNTGNSNSKSGMDDDFGGIDWDAAVLQLDAPSSSKTTSATTKSVAPVAKNGYSLTTATATTTGSSRMVDLTTNNKHSPTMTATTTGSGHLVDLTDSPPPPENNSKTRNPTAPVMTAVSLTTAGLVEQKPPLHSKPVAVSSPSKASLQPPAMLQRPTAWTTGAAMSGSPASATSNTAYIAQDPLQLTMPQVLQFDPGQVKPVNDEHRALLVKNANLSSPLLNGWTLFSHQKKAILRGLLMRRMILALDMGLGYVKCSAAENSKRRRPIPSR